MDLFFPSQLNDTQNKNVRQLVWHFQYTPVEGNELYCYNTESDRSSVVSQVSAEWMWFDRTACLQRTMDSLGITLKVYEYGQGIF